MCEPVSLTTLGYAAIAATVAAGGYTAYAQNEQGKYQAKVAKNNALTMSRMAQAATEKGTRDEQRLRLQIAHQRSGQRAAFGASGREITGSASDILADTAMMGELDALTLRYNAGLEAYGYETESNNFMAQSKLDKMSGKQAATGTLLTTAASVAGQWYTMGGAGAAPKTRGVGRPGGA
jgi:hypothetical protein